MSRREFANALAAAKASGRDVDAASAYRAHHKHYGDELVAIEAARLRAQRDARRLVDADDIACDNVPEFTTLRERLARPRAPVVWRIEGLQPAGSRVCCSAPSKTGKTSLATNLTRALVDGDRFLDHFQVQMLSGSVAIIDAEMAPAQLDEWLRAQHIKNDDRVVVLPLRGALTSFDIRLPEVRASWAARLREANVEYLIIDCLRPFLDALGLNEHREAGNFLVPLDQLLLDAGISDACLIHHFGHTNERARGDSRIRDWPDVEWRLVRQSDDATSARFFSAYGRDVESHEARLAFDPVTRRISVDGGSRNDAHV